MLQYRFITLKWLSGPVAADQVEHSMLDGIPFRRSRRIVGDSNSDPKFISELLQARFPLLTPIAIRASAISFNQQLRAANIHMASKLCPPGADRSDRKLCRVMRDTNRDIPLIAPDIIDAIRNGLALGLTRKVIDIDCVRTLPPLPTGLLEVANQLFLLRVDANDRRFPPQKCSARLRNVFELFIAPRRLFARETLAVDSHRVVALSQQTRNRRLAQPVSPGAQCTLNLAQRFMRPEKPGEWVSRRGIGHQLVKRREQCRLFFSAAFRPPPAIRMRRWEEVSPCASSFRPRRIVTRLKPVTLDISWMLPCPSCWANNPTKSRRFFSLSSATTQLILSCSFAKLPVGFSWHSAQGQRWIELRWFFIFSSKQVFMLLIGLLTGEIVYQKTDKLFLDDSLANRSCCC